MYKIILLLILVFTNIHSVLFAQTIEQEVMKPIHLLFEGMEKADTTFFTDIFAKNVVMKVVSEKGAKNESLEDFCLLS